MRWGWVVRRRCRTTPTPPPHHQREVRPWRAYRCTNSDVPTHSGCLRDGREYECFLVGRWGLIVMMGTRFYSSHLCKCPSPWSSLASAGWPAVPPPSAVTWAAVSWNFRSHCVCLPALFSFPFAVRMASPGGEFLLHPGCGDEDREDRIELPLTHSRCEIWPRNKPLSL